MTPFLSPFFQVTEAASVQFMQSLSAKKASSEEGESALDKMGRQKKEE